MPPAYLYAITLSRYFQAFTGCFQLSASSIGFLFTAEAELSCQPPEAS